MQPFKLNISNRQLKTICKQMEDWSVYCNRSENGRVRDSRTIHKNERAKSTWSYKGVKT
jgi:hypothetical protein